MWGRILGTLFGFILGRWIGAILGFMVGSYFDHANAKLYRFNSPFSGQPFGNNQQQSNDFFYAAFAVMGHIAKAKGRVSQKEIAVATALMDRMGLDAERRAKAQQAFREGKDPHFALNQVLQDLRQVCVGRHDLIQFFLELQISLAFADGEIHPNERAALYQIATQLGFSERQMAQHLRMREAAMRFQQNNFRSYYSQQQSQQQYQQADPRTARDQIADACTVLGVAADADGKTIKRAYRKLMSEHHPDKLVAKGLPPEMMEIAKEKAQEIQAAYEVLRKHHGIK
ncbi:Co-chaperone protein DjlA [Vibrio stylophorae]|uniref:Co-chaperone protein DjlA n=1 Tax=Vibrio stylophorae TaxID=659351 RepID=A0ABN8DN61_9VIBR|nr:Co-chaperone protein DjlA [Vibrio stylophorae]